MNENRTNTRTLLVAVLAQVDHGKTTLMDRLVLATSESQLGKTISPADQVMETPKTIRLMPASLELQHQQKAFHFIDLPIRYGSGREVDRVLDIADGVLWIVDAAEGPVARTRLILHSVLHRELPVFVVLNRVDLPEAKPAEVLAKIKDEFKDLGNANTPTLIEPMYSNALKGVCKDKQTDDEQPLTLMLDRMAERIPHRIKAAKKSDPFSLWINRMEFEPVSGRIPFGRIESGVVKVNDGLSLVQHGNTTSAEHPVKQLWRYDGQEPKVVESAKAGDFVGIEGAPDFHVGEVFTDRTPTELQPRPIDEPAFFLRVSVCDSPLSDSEFAIEVSADRLKTRLWEEQATNDKLLVEAEEVYSFVLAGRSELQLSMLLEMLRREGFELWVDKLRLCIKEVDGKAFEPMESLELDLPSHALEAIREELEQRSASNIKVEDHGSGRVHLSCLIPARGLLGFREEFLAATRGSGILGHRFDSWTAPAGGERLRRGGALISDRVGTCTAEALSQLQQRGSLFVRVGDPVYRGMIVGEHTQPTDLVVDPVKRLGGKEESAASTRWLVPPRTWTLEQAFQFIRGDEQIELGPTYIRFRKKP